MPIYAYRCEACGHAQDVLQKMSDPLLSTCPACGAGSFKKQLTAAGFQLKGSGWYATDFRNNGGGAPAKPADAANAFDPAKKSGEAAPAATPAPAATAATGGAGAASAASA